MNLTVNGGIVIQRNNGLIVNCTFYPPVENGPNVYITND